jgi:hypothetical protein
MLRLERPMPTHREIALITANHGRSVHFGGVFGCLSGRALAAAPLARGTEGCPRGSFGSFIQRGLYRALELLSAKSGAYVWLVWQSVTTFSAGLGPDLGSQKVEVDFGGVYLSSHGGGVILRELERHSGLLRDFAGCFVDYRDSRYIEHSVEELVSQRIHGLVLGYEDLNDHDHLRRDPIHGLIAGKSDPLGQESTAYSRDKTGF